ncbi:MAG: ribonuclease H-like domain-containing protein [Methanomassiliicoccus sp.]|nr:ribonuclease H-like domain-containing protein [Methanomassiliicoccus sp.]
MIRNTFQILPSVGNGKERTLWKSGVRDWDEFRGERKVKGISADRKVDMDRHLDRADHFLDRGMTDYFCKILPTVEHWRLYDRFRKETAFLDIETDGRSSYANVTVVGIHRDGQTIALVKGQNLSAETLSEALEGVKLMVTFNGSSFDLPILGYHFPLAVPRVPHYDLRHACRRVGLTGGLKSIEKQMGMARAREVEYVTGEEAVYLWRAWERSGSKNALKLLKRYNEEDTVNLLPIADRVYGMLKDRIVSCSGECCGT